MSFERSRHEGFNDSVLVLVLHLFLTLVCWQTGFIGILVGCCGFSRKIILKIDFAINYTEHGDCLSTPANQSGKLINTIGESAYEEIGKEPVFGLL